MLNTISLIRVLSCLAIAIFHISRFVTYNYPGIEIDFNLAGPGFHLFLQISGFVLVYITNSNDRPVRFMAKRMARIIPLYWAMTTIAVVMLCWRPWLFQGADLSAMSVLKSYMFVPGIDKINHIHPVLYVGWTLNYMMLFYALFSLSLLVPKAWQNWTAIAGLLSVMLLGNLLPQGAFRTFYTDPILLEFASGCLVGIALRQPSVKKWVEETPMWPMMTFGSIGLFLATLGHFQGWAKVMAYSPPAALVLFACAGKDLYRKPLKGQLVHRLGLLSFGVYLTHPIVLPVFGIVVGKLIGQTWLGAIALYVLTLTATIILADLAHRFIEKPSNTWLRQKLNLAPSLASKADKEPERQAHSGRTA